MPSRLLEIFTAEPEPSPVSEATLRQAFKDANAAHGPPGAEGTRRALEDNAGRWRDEYQAQVKELTAQLKQAQYLAAYWAAIHNAVVTLKRDVQEADAQKGPES